MVGFTFGSGANAIRPSAASAASVATSAITRAVGCARSYQAKPAASATASSANEASDPAHVTASARHAQQRGAGLGIERAAGAAEHARGLRGEVPAAAEHLARSARRPPGGRRRAGSCAAPTRRRTRRRGWRPARRSRPPPARAGGRPGARRAPRSMPRVGSSRQTATGGSPVASTSSSASRWRSPPDTSRGWRSASAPAPGDVVADAVVQEVVAGVLQQQRHPPRPLDACRAWARSAPPAGAAASTCRRRCGPSARPSRRARARGRRRAGSPGRPRSRTTPPHRSGVTARCRAPRKGV